MTTFRFSFAVLILAVATIAVAADAPVPEAAASAKRRYDTQVTDLKKQYDAATADAAKAHANTIAVLTEKAVNAIEASIAKAKDAGRLDKVQALKEEIDEINKNLKRPKGAAEAHEVLDAAMQKARAEYDAKSGECHAKLLAELTELEKAETRADRTKSALAVRGYREQLEQVGPPPPWSKPFAWRVGAEKVQLVQKAGGNTVSETSVVRGLLWLQKMQKPDGSWLMDGGHKSTISGTGIALLPFLAAGHTHNDDGKFVKNLDAGLKFLIGKQKADGSFADAPTMYDHAIATMALCEAFGMTSDPKLKAPAQKAVTYIVKAQHGGGGWRYSPGQAGDTSVTGWQIQALKSAQFAGLSVPKEVATRADKYLDSVAGGQGARQGATYGYLDGNGSTSMTAVGLYCRQFLGWGPMNPMLSAGIEELMKNPPRKDKTDPKPLDMYYYYYATQVLHDYGGQDWTENWNPKMRDWLIGLQVKGHPQHEGSWYPDAGGTGGAGGRLVTSCLALLTLEVYYRYPPPEKEKP